jgi:F-type H+-transporting ATPase subunit delta
MAELATVARPYAEAVFELATETGSMDHWSAILSRLAQTASDPAVAPLIGDPRISEAELVDLFMSVGGDELSGARDFVATSRRALERRFKRKVHPSVRVDDSLIGGVRIYVGDEVIDGSVRGKLAAMSSALIAP